jgi:hypothetical protein
MTIRNVEGELGRYLVQSESNPDQEYLVDVTENPVGNRCAGKCSCQDFSIRRQPKVIIAVEVTPEIFCKHCEAVQLRFAQEIAFLLYTGDLKRATKNKHHE